VKFSERYGYTKAREVIQLESMDIPLRNALWNVLKIHIWDKGRLYDYMSNGDNAFVKRVCLILWVRYFSWPLEQIEERWREVLDVLRQYYFKCEWHEVYDFIDFIAQNFGEQRFHESFVSDCNGALEHEMSAYRIVGNLVTRITDKQEVGEIDQALEHAPELVHIHLNRALEMLSDRKAPDFRNSVKESISAVESLVANVIGEKGTLGQLIKKLDGDDKLHPSMQQAFEKLYGYTSDSGGIRHGLMELKEVGFAEAKFFLVVCSAFINFVQSRPS
jgi:AbiJ N-terminal domain 4